MVRSIRLVCLAGLVLFLLGWLLPVGSASSAAAVQLDMLPPTLSLAVDDSAEVQLLVHNLTTDKLTGLTLTSVPNANLRVVIAADQLAELPANAAGTLKVTVTRLRAAASEDTLYFTLSFIRTSKEKDSVAFTDAASQSLKVTSRQPAAVENVVTMAVQAGAAPRALVETQPGRLFLTVTNKSDETLVLNELTVTGPLFLTFMPGDLSQYSPLPARSAVNLPIDLTFTKNVSIQTGKHPISLNLRLHTLGSPQVEYRLTAIHELEASIPGLSDALTWFTIPSFLFLPGILILATIGLWWRLFWKKANEEFFFKVREEGFWVVSISLSIIMALLYPRISVLFGFGERNYLSGLTLGDIALVWGVSVLLAVAGCVLFGLAHMLIVNLPLWWRNFRERNYPTGEEEPLELLAKLQAQGKQVWLERLKVKQGQQTPLVFLLQPRRGSEYWVADKPLLVKILNGDAPSGDEFRQQISRRSPLRQLMVSLQTGLDQQVLEITQRPAVFRVKKEDVLSVDPGPSSFVDLDLS